MKKYDPFDIWDKDAGNQFYESEEVDARIAELEAHNARLKGTTERLKAEAREAMKNWRRSGA